MSSQSKTKNQKPKIVSTTRRKGKIARLPKALRDKINSLLDDGASYPAIIKALQSSEPPLPFALSEQNLSRWKDGGYQDYLAAQERLQILRTAQESASDLIQNSDTTKLPEASLQLAASHLFTLLSSLSCTNVADDPQSYTKLVTSLCRLNREILSLRKYHDIAKANEPVPLLSASRELQDLERQLILDKADDILGCRAYRPQFFPNPPNHRGPSSAVLLTKEDDKAEDCSRPGPQSAELGKPNETLTSEPPKTLEVPAEPATPDLQAPNPNCSSQGHEAPTPEQPTATELSIPAAEPPTCNLQPATCNSESGGNLQPPTSNKECCPFCRSPLPRRLPNGLLPTLICPEC